MVFLLMLSGYVVSATDKIDSLNRAIEKEHDISKKARLFLELSQEYKTVDLHKSEKIAREALKLAREENNKELMGLLYAHLGDIAFLQDSLQRAEKEYDYAIPLLQKYGDPLKLIQLYISLGNRLLEKSNYPEAMDFYLKGITIAEENNYSKILPRLYNNLGVIYLNQNNLNKALELYQKALKGFEALHDTINIAGSTTNIGSIYLQMGNYSIARQYYLKGFGIFKTIGLDEGMAHALFKMAEVDQQQKKFQSALQNLLQSLDIQKNDTVMQIMSKSMFLAETYVNLGAVYLNLNRKANALLYLNKGFDLASQNGQMEIMSLAAENLSRLYKINKKYNKALEYYVLYKQYSDSVFNEENVRKLAQTEMQFRFDKKMKEEELKNTIQAQKQQRKIWIFVTVSILLFLTLIIVVLFLKLENNRKRKAEAEKKRLEDKLEHTNKELATHVLYLMKKNEFILTVITKLKKARLDAKTENKKIISELIHNLESNSGMISWEEFEIRFQEVHTDFYSNLRKSYPELSNNEIRLCAFLKLNMTTKEIAAITYQSLNSIKVARYRLRKKLGLTKEHNLNAFLARF